MMHAIKKKNPFLKLRIFKSKWGCLKLIGIGNPTKQINPDWYFDLAFIRHKVCSPFRQTGIQQLTSEVRPFRKSKEVQRGDSEWRDLSCSLVHHTPKLISFHQFPAWFCLFLCLSVSRNYLSCLHSQFFLRGWRGDRTPGGCAGVPDWLGLVCFLNKRWRGPSGMPEGRPWRQ